MQETWELWVQSLGQEDPLSFREEGMAAHSSILAPRIPWTEEPGRLQSIGSHSQTWLKQLSTGSWYYIESWKIKNAGGMRTHTHTHTHTHTKVGEKHCPDIYCLFWIRTTNTLDCTVLRKDRMENKLVVKDAIDNKQEIKRARLLDVKKIWKLWPLLLLFSIHEGHLYWKTDKRRNGQR